MTHVWDGRSMEIWHVLRSQSFQSRLRCGWKGPCTPPRQVEALRQFGKVSKPLTQLISALASDIAWYSFHMFSSLRTTPHVVLDLKSYQHILGWLYLTQISVSNMFTALNLRFRRCCLEMMAWSLSNADRAQAGGLLLLLGFGWPNVWICSKISGVETVVLKMETCGRNMLEFCSWNISVSRCLRCGWRRWESISLLSTDHSLGLCRKKQKGETLLIFTVLCCILVLSYFATHHRISWSWSLILFAHLDQIEEIPKCQFFVVFQSNGSFCSQ